MGLQKGQSGYAFRWLTPIFALVSALVILGDTFVVTFSNSIFADGFDSDLMFNALLPSLAESASTLLRLHIVVMWMISIMMLTLAILAFVMNKKGSYIFAVVGGGVSALFFLVKAIVYFYCYAQLKSVDIFDLGGYKVIMWFGVFMLFVFALSVCVCVFGAVALPKCEYEKTVGERNAVGENLTYVGFENDNATYMSNYHEPNPAGPVDPYAKPVVPDPVPVEPEKPKIYVPVGPTGSIIGTKGMYRDAKFDISDNEELVIGRDPRVAQIVIGEGAQNVSREHCRISYSSRDNSYSVKDMSKNGTFSSASRSKLPHGVYTKVPAGTEIYLGDRSNMFRLG